MELWGADHSNYSVISTSTTSFNYHTIWYGMYTTLLQCPVSQHYLHVHNKAHQINKPVMKYTYTHAQLYTVEYVH